MAFRVLQFQAVIPAETPVDAPVTVPIPMDNWALESLDLDVPPGPAGLMGFAVLNNGVRWVPYGANQWLVWDDVQQSWSLQDQPNASGWAVLGYNTGTYDHSVTVRFHVNPPVVAQPAPVAPQVVFISSDVTPQEAVTLA